MRAQIALAAVLLCMVSGPAWAGAAASLEAAPGRKIVVFDGRVWTCAERLCQARGDGRSQSLTRECARAARKLGRLVAYRRNGVLVDSAMIVVCNEGRVR